MITASSRSQTTPKAVVIGGSLGGLFAGTMLKSIGWDVDVYERSDKDLESRGGGIVLQPDVVDVFGRIGVDLNTLDLGVQSNNRVVLDRDGAIRSNEYAPQIQTSWSLIYSTLRAAFDKRHYHRGKRFVSVDQNADDRKVTARFDDGSVDTGDLLIGADGGGSSVRSLLWPDSTPTYAGYLAWRGLVPEQEMPKSSRNVLHGHFGFANGEQSHMLGYLVPGDANDTREGRRYYNWVWYRTADREQLADIMTDRNGNERGYSMPEGLLAPQWREHVYAEARAMLPRPFADVVHATCEPFAQAIRDLTVPTMVSGRVILLGDAAFIPRPHTAASTSKAAANALALARELDGGDRPGIDEALIRWEPGQLELGRFLHDQGVQSGNFLMFHRVAAT
ncbi:MAG: FAD binding domain-containing protein [Pirellulales bacterium]|nr:FAD binding domain-containing protein [Pirellulales bacterium]